MKVSVIVPVFGVERYIERCARSLFCQTMPPADIEYIFVNDCTTDSSIDILQNIVSEFPERNVTIVNHERNLGLPSARKTGISIAKGEFVINCDSDDWVHPDYCRKLYNVAQSSNSDIVVCGYSLSDGEIFWDDNWYDDSFVMKKPESIRSIIALQSSPYVWNKLIRRALFATSDIVYPTRFLAEDWAISVQLFVLANKVSYIPDKLYYYFDNPLSFQKVYTEERCIKQMEDEEVNVQLVINWLRERKMDRQFRSELVKRMSITKSKVFPVTSYRYCRKLWRKTFKEANIPILYNKHINTQYKKKHLALLLGVYAPAKYMYHLLNH